MSDCTLVDITERALAMGSPELQALAAVARDRSQMRVLLHTEGKRILQITHTIDEYSLEDAHYNYFGIRRWRHIGVGVQGSLKARIADQHSIGGRKRAPGERSNVPLPDWFDLTHVVYGHTDLGFDQHRAVWQYLPPVGEPYLNIAEVLHLRQPA